MMALADYYLCDLCESKTFYDANLDYNGHCNPQTGHPWPNPSRDVGAMAVLCGECSKNWKIRICAKTPEEKLLRGVVEIPET